jgi:hypothetical protein
MSHSQSKPDRVERRTVDQMEATLRFYTSFAHPSHEKRVDITHGDDGIPEWIVLSFRALGVGVEDA